MVIGHSLIFLVLAPSILFVVLWLSKGGSTSVVGVEGGGLSTVGVGFVMFVAVDVVVAVPFSAVLTPRSAAIEINTKIAFIFFEEN